MAETETNKYQTFKGNFYVITTGDAETTISDSKSGMILCKLPAQCQGLIFATGKEIETTAPIKINIVK